MKNTLAILTVLFLLSFVLRTASGQVQYSVTDLGTLGGTPSEALGLNNSGQVVGGANGVPFLYSGGTMQALGLPSGSIGGYATGINDSGQVVGVQNGTQVFLYSGGTMQVLNTLGYQSYADGINNSGQIVGASYLSPSIEHAFLYSGGIAQDLGTLGGSNAVALGINNRGQIVGFSTTSDNYQLPFIYSGGTMTSIGTLDGYGDAINDSGQVAGTIGNDVFLYSGGNLLDLGAPFTAYYDLPQVSGINNKGQIVGFANLFKGLPTNGTDHAFLYDNGAMHDLNDLIPSNSGWTLEQAYGINNLGQICGEGVNPSGQQDAFLLTPTPEPSTFGLLAVGAVALLGYKWLTTFSPKRREK